MARNHFSGPVVVGDDKDSPRRDVGYTLLSQSCTLDFSVTTPGAIGYSGNSGQFVTALSNTSTTASNKTNVIYPGNINATIYNASPNAYPPIATTIPADTSSLVYRGCVFYIPINSKINDFYVDFGFTPINFSGNVTGVNLTLDNNFTVFGNNPAYISFDATATSSLSITSSNRTNINTTLPVNGTAAASVNTFYPDNMQATTADITQGIQPSQLSQVVFTFAISGTSVSVPTAGKMYVNLSYAVTDPSLGSTSAYPYASNV